MFDLCSEIKKPANLAEITKERLRRAGKKIKEENPMFQGDTGFRVFKLDTSNIRSWEPEWDNLDEMIKHSVNHIKDGRSEADILYELLLKLGLDLSIPIEEKKIGNKKVQAIGAGTLMVCLDKSIRRLDAEPLALGIVEWHKQLAPTGETTCVFLDSAFADDVAKSNLSVILQQHGLENVRSL
jgi:adenine-specific DNA-methyltransferase